MYVVSLQNKTAIITGAGQGIGKAIALCLAQAQCKGITIIDIRRDATCDETVKKSKVWAPKWNSWSATRLRVRRSSRPSRRRLIDGGVWTFW